MARMEFQHRPLVKWPRAETVALERRGNVFRSKLPGTLNLLAKELAAIKAINPLLVTTDHQSINDIRIDGLPRTDISQPRNPGVILEFYAQLGNLRERLQYACDRYNRWEHNLHAIVLTLESLRAVDRYGATAAGEQYSGFKALPPPQALLWTADDAARFLAGIPGVIHTASAILSTVDRFKASYRVAAAKLHPDANRGEQQPWADLQRAADSLRHHHRL